MSAQKQKMRPREVAEKKNYRPREVGEKYAVSVDKVLAWIRSGELPAINIATTTTGRPCFLISRADLAAFEQSRRVVPPPAPVKRRRRDTEGVTQYF